MENKRTFNPDMIRKHAEQFSGEKILNIYRNKLEKLTI